MENTMIATTTHGVSVRALPAAFVMALDLEVRRVAPVGAQGPRENSALRPFGYIVSRSGYVPGSPPV